MSIIPCMTDQTTYESVSDAVPSQAQFDQITQLINLSLHKDFVDDLFSDDEAVAEKARAANLAGKVPHAFWGYPSETPIPFTAESAKGVRYFQEKHGLPVTGKVGAATYRKLQAFTPIIAGDPTLVLNECVSIPVGGGTDEKTDVLSPGSGPKRDWWALRPFFRLDNPWMWGALLFAAGGGWMALRRKG